MERGVGEGTEDGSKRKPDGEGEVIRMGGRGNCCDRRASRRKGEGKDGRMERDGTIRGERGESEVERQKGCDCTAREWEYEKVEELRERGEQRG